MKIYSENAAQDAAKSGGNGKAAAQKLKDSELKYRRLFEAARDGILILNAKTAQIVDVNPFLIEMLGYSKEEFLGKRLWEVGPFRNVSMAKEAFATLQKQHYIRYDNMPLETSHGKLISVEFVSNVYPVDGRMVIQCNIRDVTKHRKAEQALKESEEQFRAFMENAPDGVYLSDLNGTFLYGNRKCEELIGYSREELIGKSFMELNLLSEKGLARAAELLQDNKNGKSTGPDEIELISKGGRRVPVEINTSVLQHNGQPVALAFVRDITERKQADAEIAHLASFPENNPNLVIEINSDGKISYMNPAARLLFPDMASLSMSHPFLTGAEDLRKEFRDGKTRTITRQLKIADKWWQQTVLLDSSVGNILLYGSDVTERELATQNLRESEERFKNMASLLPQVIFEADEKGNFTFVNRQGLEIFGYTETEAVGMNIFETIIPQDRSRVMENIGDLIKGQNSPSNEYTALRKDGSKFPVRIYASPITLNSKYVGMRGILVDITESKQAEELLQESELKYRSLVTQSPDGIFIVNLKGTFLAVNRVMHESLKYSEEELLSMSIWDIVPEQYRDVHEKRMSDILTGKTPNTAAEYMVKGKDGNLHCVEILSAPYYEGKQLIGFQGIARDITERKKTEDTLKESEAKYRAVIEAAVDQIFVIDSEMKILSMNSFAAGFFHKKPEDMVGKSLFEIFPEQVAANTSANIREVFATGTNKIVEEVLTFGDKNIWNSTSLSPMKDLNGKVIAVIGIVRDITASKQYEKELIKSHQKTKNTLNDAINTMAKIVEMRDPYTSGHQQRVAQLATAIAGEMGCGVDQIEQLRMAATIHDIGKIHVPSDILSKPGKISKDEFNLIKTHAQGGYDIVKGMDFPSAVAQSILQHHERLDGSGYPNGLKGDQICLEAKILSVSDVVEAMSSHRPYRAKLGIDQALQEISENRGKLYDPDVVDACIKLFNSGKFEFKPIVPT